jgi:hypothetical protein
LHQVIVQSALKPHIINNNQNITTNIIITMQRITKLARGGEDEGRG